MDALTFGNAPAGVVGFGDVEDWVFDNIDGLYARNEGDISFVMNPSIYKVLGKARRQTGAAATDLEDATTALQYLRNMSGGGYFLASHACGYCQCSQLRRREVAPRTGCCACHLA